jgi:hypothetical protein
MGRIRSLSWASLDGDIHRCVAIWFWQIVGTSPDNPDDVRLVKSGELREVKPEISSDDR